MIKYNETEIVANRLKQLEFSHVFCIEVTTMIPFSADDSASLLIIPSYDIFVTVRLQ